MDSTKFDTDCIIPAVTPEKQISTMSEEQKQKLGLDKGGVIQNDKITSKAKKELQDAMNNIISEETDSDKACGKYEYHDKIRDMCVYHPTHDTIMKRFGITRDRLDNISIT